MVKIFLFFSDFGREDLRVWPKKAHHEGPYNRQLYLILTIYEIRATSDERRDTASPIRAGISNQIPKKIKKIHNF